MVKNKMALPWEKKFGKEQVSDRSSKIRRQEFNPSNEGLKCKYCGKVSMIEKGTENANTFRCSHCGMALKVSEAIDISQSRNKKWY